MNWRANVAFARGLSKHGLEVTNRTAVNRAYYGAFNLSRRWLEMHVTPIDNRSAHQQVWQTFKTAEQASDATRTQWRLIGRLGDSLRQLRNQVDYDDRVEELESRTHHGVASAERIVRLLTELEASAGDRD